MTACRHGRRLLSNPPGAYMKHFTIAARLNIMAVLPLAMLLAISLLAGFGLRMDRDALKEVYGESETSRMIGSIVTDMYRIRMTLGNAIITTEGAEAGSRVKSADALMTEIMRKWNVYLDSGLSTQNKQAAEQTGKDLDRMLDSTVQPALVALRRNDREA